MGIKLVVIGGKQAGMEIPIRRPKFLIGRGEDCQLRPQSHLISRKHCAILVEEGKAFIEDFGSTNGTFVNGVKVEKRQALNSKDHIKVGMFELEIRLPVEAEAPKEPETQSIKPAAIRAAAPPDADLEISNWLADDNEEQASRPLAKKSVTDESVTAAHDTIAGKPSDDTTTTMPTDQTQDKKDKKGPVKVVGQFKRPAKPMAESSRSAAEDMLRQFFPKKKP